MWKSELVLLIYRAIMVWTTVAARPLGAHYLAGPRPGIAWRLVPWLPPESPGALLVPGALGGGSRIE